MKSDQLVIIAKECLATNSIRTNQNVFASGNNPLLNKNMAANDTKYLSFGSVRQPVELWTPTDQKSINLTAIQVSAPLGVTVTLSSNDHHTLFSFRLTQSNSTISQALPSACSLEKNQSILVSTSAEERDCNSFGASTATQTAINSRSDFTNVANAAGLADGQVATLNSALLTQTGGRIGLTYSIGTSAMSQLQIESVVLKFYCFLELTLEVGISTMTLYWRPTSSGNWTELQQLSRSIIGSLNYLTTPLEQDITAAVLASAHPWEVIANLQASFVGTHTGLGVGNTIQLDAVEVEICVTGLNEITLCGFET